MKKLVVISGKGGTGKTVVEASDTPETVVQAFLDGTIVSGKNLCDH